ncbi:MAG: hypothetical protein KIS87_07345 [Phycisphaeraceae bacterium]|nr:hypothetical protein [Phycisphaeraceae bacterium]
MDRERQDEPEPRPFTPFPEQDENGVDLTLLRENLRLTPEERIRRGDVARRQALHLMDIGRKRRESAIRGLR